MCSHERNESVSTEVQGFSQPDGRPISDSTNRGFRSALGGPFVPSVGVVWGWWERAWPANVIPWVTPWVGACFVVRFSFIEARGVLHIFA